ncbi:MULTISPECIES: DUF2868 domain-containing protein [unclassified Duganella]|uniref:DUF2868 domain-containing protein n=1 Tax=unclassified Duganella TaxID=2636909 RepID=UPI0006FEB4A4|nr:MULTISPECIES: DUF2868 domain-containing protein [unclassified Duganella]KQV46748.1 hypothetical protein ASD07_14950 [Duganella sp. Root336D2]KRC00979.1 hypothetical protein ASE26_21940 [Duganella sp. Root198D2]
MNEKTARAIMLVKAIEEADQHKEVLTDDDRKFASRTARELAHWQAAEQRSASSLPDFLFHRAEQLLKRLAARHKMFASVTQGHSGMWGASWLLPVAALLVGAMAERFGDPHRVDLLSMPLLGIIAWNMLAYLLLIVWALLPARRAGLRRGLANRMALGGGHVPRRLPHALAGGVLQFMVDWARVGARLNQARIARILHWSAAAFAVGAVLSLYARGIVERYATGWESTFLSPWPVYRVLSVLFAPVEYIFGLEGFTLDEVMGLQNWGESRLGNGARWVHLYAASLLLYVVLPRLVLGSVAAVRAIWLRRHFPLDLEQAYYHQLSVAAGGEPGLLRVLPYSLTVDEARSRGLDTVAQGLLGEQARVRLLPPAAYGSEAPALEAGNGVTNAVLFGIAATPEQENHGVFLAAVGHGRKLIALLDQSALAARMDATRLGERIELWREFCILHGAEPMVVDLLAPAAASGNAA